MQIFLGLIATVWAFNGVFDENTERVFLKNDRFTGLFINWRILFMTPAEYKGEQAFTLVPIDDNTESYLVKVYDSNLYLGWYENKLQLIDDDENVLTLRKIGTHFQLVAKNYKCLVTDGFQFGMDNCHVCDSNLGGCAPEQLWSFINRELFTIKSVDLPDHSFSYLSNGPRVKWASKYDDEALLDLKRDSFYGSNQYFSFNPVHDGSFLIMTEGDYCLESYWGKRNYQWRSYYHFYGRFGRCMPSNMNQQFYIKTLHYDNDQKNAIIVLWTVLDGKSYCLDFADRSPLTNLVKLSECDPNENHFHESKKWYIKRIDL